MPRRVGQVGASGVSYIGQPSNSPQTSFNFQTPAGWAMLWWGLSVLVILGMFLML